MKKVLFLVCAAAVLVNAAGNLYGVGEKTIRIGAGSGWEAMENRSGLAEISGARPHPVLALDSARASNPALNAADLSLSFDEGVPGRFADSMGRWQVSAAPGVEAVDFSLARAGTGAARFHAGNFTAKREFRAGVAQSEGSLLASPGRNSVFSSGGRAGDFSIEFWLFPLNLGNGEEVFAWTSSREDGPGNFIVQKLECTVSKNRLHWDFSDFFTDPAGLKAVNISFSGEALMPGEWRHHLVRFDSGTGLIEYLVNGRLEAVDYTTVSGREGGDVYTPLMGRDNGLLIGRRFSGLVDEFRVYGSFLETPLLSKFPEEGRTETRTIDLGSSLSRVLKLEAFGGRTKGAGHNPENFFAGNRILDFSDHSEIRFFVRMNNTPYSWDAVPWIPVKPGEELNGIAGRYIQAAADFYPSGDGEITPYLDELRIIYKGTEPPRPPSLVTARAVDGGVDLSWRPSPSAELGGYLIYFGTAGGEYFGNYALMDMEEVKSPINAGNRTGARIEGLEAGKLYYFAVAAYDTAGEAGEFSRETAARPLGGRSGGVPQTLSGLDRKSVTSSPALVFSPVSLKRYENTASRKMSEQVFQTFRTSPEKLQ